MSPQRLAYVYGLAAVLLWSTVATAFKLTLQYLDYAQLLLYSSFFSICILFFILLTQSKLKTLVQLPKSVYLQSIILGLLNPFIYYLVLFKAYSLLPAQEAQAINYSWAITLSLLSVPLLKQKLSLTQIAAGILCYSGVFVIATRGDIFSLQFSNASGVALAFGSTLIWALYWILNAKDPIDPVQRLFLNFLFGFPFILIYCLVVSDIKTENLFGVLGAAYIGCFEMGFAFLLWLLALRKTNSAAKISNLIFIAPFLSILFIHNLLGELIRLSTYIGLTLVVIGLSVQKIARKE